MPHKSAFRVGNHDRVRVDERRYDGLVVVTARRTRKGVQMPIDRPIELSEQVLESVEHGQRTAIEAVRKFVETVDKTLPLHGEEPSKRQEVIDSALEMADRLVQTQYDFLRSIVQTAGKSLGGSDDAK